MLSAIRPTFQTSPMNAASDPAVSNPHAPAAAEPADAVALSVPAPLDARAEVHEKSEPGRKAAIVAAGLAAAVLTGALVPVVGGLLQTVPQTVSQNVRVPVPGGVSRLASNAQTPVPAQAQEDPAQPGQPQDPAQLVAAMAMASEQSAQALPQANQVHADWGKDLAAMQATAKDMAGHVDALMRDSKKDAAAHHTAIDAGLATLTRQVNEFQSRLQKEQPAVDQFVGQNRDNLNQVGTISFNLERNIEDAASQYGYFTPERQALRDLGRDVHRATLDLSMATEKASTVRAEDKALADNMKAVQEILGQVQKATEASRTDSKAMGQVDNGVRVLENAFKILGQLTEQSQKDVQEAASRSHKGAEDLLVVWQSFGGGAQQQAPAVQK